MISSLDIPMPKIDHETLKKIATILGDYFKAEPEKIVYWLMTPNPMVGGIIPAYMCMIGREKKLLKIMEAMRDGNFA